MGKYQVLISAPYMMKGAQKQRVEELLAPYKAQMDFHWSPVQERLEENELEMALEGMDAIICGDDRFSERVYKSSSQLKVVVKWGTGIDSIKEDLAKKYKVLVRRTPNAFTIPVSESTLAYLLNFSRQVKKNDDILKGGGWDKPQGFCLHEKRIGLIGFGNIGKEVARKLQVFNAKVYVCDIREISKKEAKEYGVTVLGQKELLSTCEIISLHCDLNERSENLMSRKEFALMKKSSYLINMSRGGLVNEKDLISALEEGVLSGAALDVFETEPLPFENSLRKMSNVLLAAHNSNSSQYYWDKVHLNSISLLIDGLLKTGQRSTRYKELRLESEKINSGEVS